MHRIVILAICLMAACSGDKQNADGNQTLTAAKTNAPKTPSSVGGDINPPAPVAPARRGYDPPRLYVNDRGVHFEIFELDDLPYNGKVVTYHDGEQKIIATEKVFEKGRLDIEREYWPNAKPKFEIIHGLGSITTNRYDRQGNEIKPPSNTTNNPAPATRTLNWTYNYTGGNTRLEAFIRQNTNVLVQYLGEPDSKLNNAWVYRNMRITDARTRRQHTSVRFNISGNNVSSVVLLE